MEVGQDFSPMVLKQWIYWYSGKLNFSLLHRVEMECKNFYFAHRNRIIYGTKYYICAGFTFPHKKVEVP